MSGRKHKSTQRWSMYPSLQSEVTALLEKFDLDSRFHSKDHDFALHTYDTNIMGRFSCPNDKCGSTGWSSKKIAITIRMYTGNKYNARRLSRPIFDDSYTERVAYRLKKWSGVEMEAPVYSGESHGPHIRSLCEGCKAGHCFEGRWYC
ncbi:hypothetical protein ASPACDRAFT_53726 [Aspergillus aculeatus ATCC 16872]|uniref:3CxxC-type domain-containing protein n=1 Tax=Aspergillus aculeatus (strain ATCC 16872 / CBS 172.66 / WB 5094) TaxID=690307 RepID=A0A1L9WN02_ASPA1|nr:uncharacterized protein ASPACDRAFT_53726 [Aspergillus aculeatus ATCC 16872]OJJ97543.1 hypothetical protein ASPACDRAFT_53726 [Aspergillus aculeatus ATCC 16872]